MLFYAFTRKSEDCLYRLIFYAFYSYYAHRMLTFLFTCLLIYLLKVFKLFMLFMLFMLFTSKSEDCLVFNVLCFLFFLRVKVKTAWRLMICAFYSFYAFYAYKIFWPKKKKMFEITPDNIIHYTSNRC